MGINNKSEIVGWSGVSLIGGPAMPVYWGPNADPAKNFVPIDIGNLGGNIGSAQGINDGSYVVGRSRNSFDQYRAFLWDPVSGQKTDLGDLGGISKTSLAFAINIHGMAVGKSIASTVGYTYNACLFELNKAPVNLSTPNTDDSSALGINDSGIVVGQCNLQGVIWENGVMKVLTVLASHGIANQVNNSGEVTGYVRVLSSDPFRGFIWDKFKGSRYIDLWGATGTFCQAINNKTQVVGYAEPMGAFIWEESKGAVDLNSRLTASTDWQLYYATGINDKGEIVGFAMQGNAIRAFLLRPKKGAWLPAVLLDLLTE
jgi:probable HAF family extracellular repeat protein